MFPKHQGVRTKFNLFHNEQTRKPHKFKALLLAEYEAAAAPAAELILEGSFRVEEIIRTILLFLQIEGAYGRYPSNKSPTI